MANVIIKQEATKQHVAFFWGTGKRDPGAEGSSGSNSGTKPGDSKGQQKEVKGRWLQRKSML